MTARFLTELDITLVKDSTDYGSGTWRVHSPLVYFCEFLRWDFTVPAGFETDLGSVPRWLPLAYALVGNIDQIAATLHDWLYTTHPVDRRTADNVLFEAMLSRGTARWRCASWWIAVRLFGWMHWQD